MQNSVIKPQKSFLLGKGVDRCGGGIIGKHLASRPASAAAGFFDFSPSSLVNRIIAVICSGLIAVFCIGIFAQDIRIPDVRLNSVIAQPAVGQIVFAVLVSFGIAAFLVKKFLDASYIWPITASALTTGFALITSLREDP